MAHPVIDDVPGLKWREHGRGWEARWVPRRDLVRRGFGGKVARLWVGKELTDVDRAWISDTCNRLQSKMLAWGRGLDDATSEAGTLGALINTYQTDKVSPFHQLRYHTREHYDTIMRLIAKQYGHVRLGAGFDEEGKSVDGIRARTILTWHAEWRVDRGVAMAHRLVTMLRMVIRFGATYLENEECERLTGVLHGMKFQMSAPRSQHLTVHHVEALRDMAHTTKVPRPSIALAQAFQFECTLRQKDVIGEYVPLAEPGTSEVVAGDMKWIRGLRWSEIDKNMILRHTTSKKQKDIEVNLRLAPMVLEELTKQFGFDGTRESLPISGPIIVSETSGVPYQDHVFRRLWREIATEAGIPKNVRNMDSRAGAITEATNSGASLEDVRHAAAHSNVSMTARYSRAGAEKTAEVMRLRVENRNKK